MRTVLDTASIAPEALQTIRHDRTRVLVNVHETPVADAVRHPDAQLQTDLLVEKMRFSAGDAQVEAHVRQRVEDLCARFPIYEGL